MRQIRPKYSYIFYIDGGHPLRQSSCVSALEIWATTSGRTGLSKGCKVFSSRSKLTIKCHPGGRGLAWRGGWRRRSKQANCCNGSSPLPCVRIVQRVEPTAAYRKLSDDDRLRRGGEAGEINWQRPNHIRFRHARCWFHLHSGSGRQVTRAERLSGGGGQGQTPPVAGRG